MTPERWNAIYDGFKTALSQPSNSRAEFLQSAFPDDTTLREEVSRLLRDAEEAEQSGFLKDPAWIADDRPVFLPNFRHGDSDFSNIQYIGHGGMGVVYKAYQRNLDKYVALKLCSPDLTTSANRERFRAEAQNMAQLKHPNIVTVHETGDYDGRPYFVMELIEGKPLNEQLTQFTERPQDAAALVQAIALAVHHAHQRRILHNDLKPANILLDEEGNPHVTDFGLATRLEEGESSSASGVGAGTAAYMAPEQAEGKEITTATDVWGLGAILYTLLTGTPPFRGSTVQETLQRVRYETPKPPRLLNPKVDPTLEAICLKCLKKDKVQRYASANALAQDLIRYQAGKETTVLPWTRRERFLAWLHQNAVQAALITAVIAIWIFALVMALSVAQARKKDRLTEALNSVSFAAEDVAANALLQLRSWSAAAQTAATGGALADLIRTNDRDGLLRLLREICPGQSSSFQACFVLNADGRELSDVHGGQPYLPDIGQWLGWRDYFEGPKRQASCAAGAVHISRVYRGVSDNFYKFAIAVPILDQKKRFLGVLASSLTTDATMGLVALHDPSSQVALLAPRDADSPTRSPTGSANPYVVLFHPAYRYGIPAVEVGDASRIRRTLDPVCAGQLESPVSNLRIAPDDHYQDPVASVSKAYRGRWIAGFSPVGNTGFIVVVQKRFEQAVSLESSTYWDLALWSALVSLVAVAILIMVLWRWARSQALADGG